MPKKPTPDLIRSGYRFSEKIMLQQSSGGIIMRAFLAALVAAAVIAVVGGVVLAKFQEPVSEAYSTQGVRL
jgi:hypothetical protein